MKQSDIVGRTFMFGLILIIMYCSGLSKYIVRSNDLLGLFIVFVGYFIGTTIYYVVRKILEQYK